ncbi:MAG TPA: dihydrolipoamide acetyltransferase family protein [Solirubrobacteraceae bacterium]|nr:dihydrolipoamide acetyltransferase family protein [Solirubrobacteraceae bacterium]
MADIVMPRLSDTMEEGTILRWLKADGEEVARGEELVEIETDKANMTYESDQAGALEIVAEVGQTLAVGAVIARVGVVAGAASGQEVAPDREPAADRERASYQELAVAHTAAADSPTADVPIQEVGSSPDHRDVSSDGERVRASPLARRMAREGGVDLHHVTGSGPGGRIVKADVIAASRSLTASSPATPNTPAATPAPAAAPAPAAPVAPVVGGAPVPGAATSASASSAAPALEGVMTAKGETTTIELTRTQQAVARRMAESKATIPDFTLQMDIDMEACVALRKELKGLSASQAPTYNDMIVKAAALALREHPRANGSYRDAQVQVYSRVNVGVAVAAQDALVVPTVFDADEKSLGEIARETRALAEHVRDGTITPPQLGGGTFTVSNLGMYGVRSFSAIINPPQAAILSVGSLEPRAVAREGGITIRHTMMLTLACDHRILYGADAAQFLARIRQLLEAPAALTL